LTLALALAPLALAQSPRAIEWTFVRGSDLYAVYTDSTDARQLTTDGRPKTHIVRSPDGSRVAFLADPGKNALGTLVVLSADGAPVSESVFRPFPRTAGSMAAVEELEWLTPDRLVLTGGFDADASEHVIVDAATGKELAAHLVGGLAWNTSPGGAHIAYEYFNPRRLCVDNECLPQGPGGYPAREGRLRFYWGPVWSPDASRFAILAREPVLHDKHIVVLKEIGGPWREIDPPFPYESLYLLSWEGPDLILTYNNRRWKLDPERPEFVPLRK
jgi:hypothetical protein